MTTILACIICWGLGVLWERGSAAKREALKAKADYLRRKR